MITQKQFVNRVFDNFDKLHEKIDENHKEVNEKVTDLCARMRTVESTIKSHIAVGDVINVKKKEKREVSNKRFYIVMAIIGTGFTAINTLISLITN